MAHDRRNPVAERFSFIGPGVRLPRSDDTIADLAGATVTPFDGIADPERPAADGLGPGVLATRGFAWLHIVGPARGSQASWDRLDLAKDGDDLGVIADGGPDTGAVRRAQPGDLCIGSAICIDEGLVLARLHLTR